MHKHLYIIFTHSKWVEFNAPPDTIKVISEAENIHAQMHDV